MTVLATNLRSLLERAITDARSEAEAAAEAALTAIGVENESRPGYLDDAANRLRLALGARARALGKGNLKAGMPALVEEVAYEQWHRMLFARFLAENRLLIDSQSQQPVSLQDCVELAEEDGKEDAWLLAASFAGQMLPGIFRSDDPAAAVRLAPEGRSKLEGILVGLPADVFTADDALGWVYQFWQAQKKDEVNKSGRKIGGEDIAAVTQLFTEHYMVRFLLENSLGAWWAVRHPHSLLLGEWEYLRFREDGTPAAGTFPAWPEQVKDVTVMDPCCGSGHFLVAAGEMMRKMRMEEENLTAAQAASAVLQDNLFGLEIDPRCTQIAAFALAFDAWKATGYRNLPLPNVACSGVVVGDNAKDWTDLANGDNRLEYTLERLYELFKDAPDLGSLINPAQLAVRDRMFVADYEEVGPLLRQVLTKHGDDPAAAVFGAAVEGAARAGDLLARQYTLVATNVPYRGSGDLNDVIKGHMENQYPLGKKNLATAFVLRSRWFVRPGGSYALVTLHEWLFLKSYQGLRESMLREQSWHLVARLGPSAFQTISGQRVNVALTVVSNSAWLTGHSLSGLDVAIRKTPAEKAFALRTGQLTVIEQDEEVKNPDFRISLESSSLGVLLSSFAVSLVGVQTGDNPYYLRRFWEIDLAGSSRWERSSSSEASDRPGSGHEWCLRWEGGHGQIHHDPQARIQGTEAFGHQGVLVSRVQGLRCSPYHGELFDQNVAVVLPRKQEYMLAVWCFCSSPEFVAKVRRIDQKLNVTNATLVKVPFDFACWQKEADRLYPNGFSKLVSQDPSQWPFVGNVVGSEAPLQVAVARLLGYRWPDQQPDELDALANDDGILCLPTILGEARAADRLRQLLARAYGASWFQALEDRLLIQAGSQGKTLDTWLTGDYFAQHCKLFHNRPFIWHIDDGLKGRGFSALLNYHLLDGPKLGRLIYTYLQPYLNATKVRVDAGEPGADALFQAATTLKEKLEAIRRGEPPYDIYVRWKALHEQAIGWEPDIEDGIRLNIRPWVAAGILRSKLTINWNKDRGANVDGAERINDRHYTRADKEAARRAAGVPT